MTHRLDTHAKARGKKGSQKAVAVRAAQQAADIVPHRSAPSSTAAAGITSRERQQLIAEAAYFIAEQRGFAPGRELDDWAQAEAEIDMRLRGTAH